MNVYVCALISIHIVTVAVYYFHGVRRKLPEINQIHPLTFLSSGSLQKNNFLIRLDF